MTAPHETPPRRHLGFLLDRFPLLADTATLSELLGLEACGLGLRVFARSVSAERVRQPGLTRLRAEIEELPAIRELDPWTVMFAQAHGEPIVDRVRQVAAEGGEWRHPRFPSLLAEALHLSRRCRELGIRHLHVRGTDAAVTARLLLRLGGPTYSMTVESAYLRRRDADDRLIHGLLTEASFAVAVCDADVRDLDARVGGEATARVRRLYDSVDLSLFPFRSESWPVGAQTTGPATVVVVARLIERKGLSTMLEAVRRVLDRGVALRLRVLGEGPEHTRLARQASSLDLQGIVGFEGACDLDAVADALAKAAVFCLPSVVLADGDRDVVPLALVEALAAGVPVVSTPVGAIPEILSYGRAGSLTDPGNAEGLADALMSVLADPEEARRRSVAGREQVEHYFDRERNTETLARWLCEVELPDREDSGEVLPTPLADLPLALHRPPRVVIVDRGLADHADAGAAIQFGALESAFLAMGAEVTRLSHADPLDHEGWLGREMDRGVDVIYERYEVGSRETSLLAAEAAIPHVVYVDSARARLLLRYEGRVGSEEERLGDAETLGAASAVIVPSSEIAAYAEERGASPETIHLFYNGVDPDLFRPRGPVDPLRRQLVPGGRVVIGFHGRLQPWHGLELVAEAAGRLLARGAPVHLVVVGEGDFETALARRIPDGCCTRVGWVPHEEVPRYVAAFDIFAMGCGSETQVSTPPLKLVEAMACGVVPVVPRAGDLPVIVGHGREGWVYRAASRSSLEAGLTRVIEDDALRARLAVASRTRALELSWKKMASFVLEKALRPQLRGTSAVDPVSPVI